jgi:uncharacterized protein (DUF2384 family)
MWNQHACIAKYNNFRSCDGDALVRDQIWQKPSFSRAKNNRNLQSHDLLTLYTVYICGILEWSLTVDLAKYADDGLFAPSKIAHMLRTTSEEIGRCAGLGKDAFQRKDRISSDKTQRRLREMMEVVNKVESRFGSALMANAWYRSEPLSGFSGQTAMQLVRSGRAEEVLDYIDAVDAGIHA